MATHYGKTCENENYGGMCRIYVDLYRDLLWAVFIKEVPIPKLVSELENILKHASSFKHFHHQFKRLLDVYASTGTIQNTDCDISVIYSLFRNIPTTLVPPTRGWGKVPQPGDDLVTDDLERIHHGRNELTGHPGEARITDAHFTAQLSDIKDIVTRLDGPLGSYLSHLLQIESDCQSGKTHLKHYDEYINELKRQQDAEADLRAKFDKHDTKFDEHDIRLGGHDTHFDEHDTQFDEHNTRLRGHDTKFDEHNTKFDKHNTKFDEHDTKFDKHNTKFDEHDTRLGGHDTTFDEHDTRLRGHDATFDEHHTKLEEHDTKFENLETKMVEHEQIYSRVQRRQEEERREKHKRAKELSAVQHTREEHNQERDEDRRRLTGMLCFCCVPSYTVQRRQEKERREKQKREKELSAGQDELKKYLLKLYRDKILQEEPNVWFSMKDVLHMVVPLDIREDLERWMALSRAKRKKKRTSKAREGTKIKSKREMFFKGLERQFEIYILGEAGVGKSTFCHQLIDNWCKVQNTESNDDYLCELKSFPFLFFIQARHAKQSQSVYEMIQTQNCPLKFRSILEEVFTSHPENCLVLIDGLDEWQSGTRGYQELPNVTEIEGSTILITSRPWRIEALDCELPYTSCRVLEIRGLDSNGITNLACKALEAFTREDHPFSDCESLVKPFLDQMYALKLDILAKIPLILLILISSWLDGNRKLENARGFIYSGLIESLLIHSDKKLELSQKWGDRTKPNTLPTCFSERGNCLDYNLLLNGLARLAFDHLFSAEKENTLVIRKHDLAKQPEVEEHLQMCLKLGLLMESKDFSETNECHRAFEFPHKSIQEFFCAVYLSGEEFETGFVKFCERVTSSVEVADFENVVLFVSGMNLTHCKTLFDYICNIVFARHFADETLYPTSWSSHDMIINIHNLALLCTSEARHYVPEMSHNDESQFVIPDMVVETNTPESKVGQFCRLGLNIKSLVYMHQYGQTTVTPFSVVQSIKTMQYIQRLGIGCTAKDTEKYIVCICKYLSNLHQLKSFSFCVADSTVRLLIHISTELVSKLGTLSNLVSVYLQKLDLSDINTCQFTSQLTSLGLYNTKPLSPGVMSGWCNQLHTLYMLNVDLSPAAVHQLCQYLMTSSSLQSLTLIPLHYDTVFDDVLDLTSHTSLHKLKLWYIDMKSGVRIHPGHHWRKMHMYKVSMSESMWQEFIHNLPTEPLHQLDVKLLNVTSLNTQTMSYIRDKFCVTLESDWRYISFSTKH